MPEFWKHSGLRLLERTPEGLRPTDDFLRAYLLRPELRPVEESCAHEVALHDFLLDAPRSLVADATLAQLEDGDARDNYRAWLAYRDRLLAAGTLESCYMSIFSAGNVGVAPLFLDQLAHIVVHGMLEDCEDTLQLRASELFYREQRVSIEAGEVLLADRETVDMRGDGGTYGNLGRLLAEAQVPLAGVELEVLNEENAAAYWQRDEANDFVLAVTHGRPGLAALARVLERWIGHFLCVQVKITPVAGIEDRRWIWHLGLDAAASVILDNVYRGETLDAGQLRQILALFRLEFADPAEMRADLAGRAVYLGMAMNESGILRLKPQNLLLNLPLAASS